MDRPDLARRRSITALLAFISATPALSMQPMSGVKLPPTWRFDLEQSDEFDGAQLDAMHWHNHDPGWTGRPPSRFDPGNVGQGSGRLRLTSSADTAPAKTYRTAAIKARKPMRYGYLETRARAGASAVSSSFWLYANDEQRWTEIDVFELCGAPGQDTTLNTAAHVFHDRTAPPRAPLHLPQKVPLDFRVQEDFHVYGLAWTPERIEWWVNGRLVRTLGNAHWHQPLHVMFDSEVFTNWFGLPHDSTLPAYYDVDYLRVWRAPGTDL